jgi:NAD-dependent deacetylase
MKRDALRFLPEPELDIDDLHEQAGSKNVIHLHGRINSFKCSADCQSNPTPVDITRFEVTTQPPSCPHCGEFVRPDVVLYGELLPQYDLNRANELSEQCDVMLVVGTSGLVSPADSLPKMARKAFASIIEVNPNYSMITRIADLKLEAAAGVILPEVIALLETL